MLYVGDSGVWVHSFLIQGGMGANRGQMGAATACTTSTSVLIYHQHVALVQSRLIRSGSSVEHYPASRYWLSTGVQYDMQSMTHRHACAHRRHHTT
jgi:hypothetical protein